MHSEQGKYNGSLISTQTIIFNLYSQLPCFSWDYLKSIVSNIGGALDNLLGNVDDQVGLFLTSGKWYEYRDDRRNEFNCFDKKFKCPSRCKYRRECGVRWCQACTRKLGVRICSPPYPCGQTCGRWDDYSFIRNKVCIEETIEKGKEMEEELERARETVSIVEDNNENNVKGLRYAAVDKERLGNVFVGVDPIRIRTATGGQNRKLNTRFSARGIGLPILRPDSTELRREDAPLSSDLDFDFFNFSGDQVGDMEDSLKKLLAPSAADAVLRDTRLDNTEFSDFAAFIDPPSLAFQGSNDRMLIVSWDSCSTGEDSSGLQEAWTFGQSSIIEKVKEYLLSEISFHVSVDELLTVKSFSYIWSIATADFTCSEFQVALELQVSDSGGRRSEPLYFDVHIPYGHPTIEKAANSSLSEATRCHDDPIDAFNLQQYGLAIPEIADVNCASPFLDLDSEDLFQDTGILCTTSYSSFRRVWSLVSTRSECGLPGGSDTVTLTQTVVLGGRYGYSIRPEFVDTIDEDLSQEEIFDLYEAMVEDGIAIFAPATPYFVLEDATFILPDLPNAAVATSVDNFLKTEPYPECGLCSEASDPITFSHPQDFVCDEVGQNEINVTALNNIGMRYTDYAIAIVLDISAPNITCDPFVIVPCGEASPDESAGYPDVIDNCQVASLTFHDVYDPSFDDTCPDSLVRTWTVMDPSGNTATCTQTIVQVAPSLTTGTFCSFDKNMVTEEQEFRALFAPDGRGGTQFVTTNPTLLYYNLFFFGSPGDILELRIDIPYPFVTLGEFSISAYQNLTISGDDERRACLVDKDDDKIWELNERVSWDQYHRKHIGSSQSIQIDTTIPETSFIHIAVNVGFGKNLIVPRLLRR